MKRVVGVKETMRMFHDMRTAMQNRILRPAMRKLGPIVVKEVKSRAKQHKETGLLWKSFGHKVYTRRPSSPGVGSKIIIRAGFRKMVSVHRGKRKRLGVRVNKRKTMSQRASKSRMRDPRHYAHLMDKGFTDRSGKFHQGSGFQRKAADAKKTLVTSYLKYLIKLGIDRESAKAYAKTVARALARQ